MKYLFLFYLSISFSSTAQEIKFFYEKSENGYSLTADNFEFSPVTVIMRYSLENLTVEGSDTVVLDPIKRRQYIGELKVIDRKKPFTFTYTTKYNYGDTFQEEYDIDYEYGLPFLFDSTYLIMQGYNGNFSHQDKFALDIDMPIGTPILATRDGIVINVVENNNKGCPTKECLEFNNLIKIMHVDGSFAEYIHLKQDGASVMKGHLVKKGQIIGYSGNTGWSSDPHLHFEVFLQKLDRRTTLPTLFKIEPDKPSINLEQGIRYQNLIRNQ